MSSQMDAVVERMEMDPESPLGQQVMGVTVGDIVKKVRALELDGIESGLQGEVSRAEATADALADAVLDAIVRGFDGGLTHLVAGKVAANLASTFVVELQRALDMVELDG